MTDMTDMPVPPTLTEIVGGLTGQTVLVPQQVGQLYEAVRQLYEAVEAQGRQLLDSDRATRQELQKFQTGGAQRAMAGVFHKLFRELVGHGAQLDELAQVAGAAGGEAGPWATALRLLGERFDAMLIDWGCRPAEVRVGDEFDPERHEAVPDAPTADQPTNRVTDIRRRGWNLHDQVLQYPLVVVE